MSLVVSANRCLHTLKYTLLGILANQSLGSIGLPQLSLNTCIMCITGSVWLDPASHYCLGLFDLKYSKIWIMRILRIMQIITIYYSHYSHKIMQIIQVITHVICIIQIFKYLRLFESHYLKRFDFMRVFNSNIWIDSSTLLA